MKELIEKIAETDPKEFSEALHESAGRHFQFIFNGGHKSATKDARAREKELQDQLERAQEETEKAKKSLEQLRGEKGSEGDWQQKMQDALDRQASEFSQKEEAHQTENKRLRGVLRGKTLSRVRSDVVSKMLTDHGVVARDFAEVKVLHPDFEKRLRINDEGDVVGALQKDGETPLPIPNGQSIEDVLASELAQTIPEPYRGDTRQSGAGIGKGGSGSKRIYRESELNDIPDKEFANPDSDINRAMSEGRIIPG